jgi:adenylate kinase
MANRRICTANGHVYNLASNPPLVPGICDIDSSPIIQRPDDEEATVRARMKEQIPPLLEVVEYYRKAGVLQKVDGREPITDVSARVLAAIDSPTLIDVPASYPAH